LARCGVLTNVTVKDRRLDPEGGGLGMAAVKEITWYLPRITFLIAAAHAAKMIRRLVLKRIGRVYGRSLSDMPRELRC
jgi:hypothetical protein